jgi:hypothetical protein
MGGEREQRATLRGLRCARCGGAAASLVVDGESLERVCYCSRPLNFEVPLEDGDPAGFRTIGPASPYAFMLGRSAYAGMVATPYEVLGLLIRNAAAARFGRAQRA